MKELLTPFFVGLQTNPLYWYALAFFGGYPVLSAIMWVTTGLHFFWRREQGEDSSPSPPELT